MDLENQQRVKDIAESTPAEDIIVVLGGAEAQAAKLMGDTVTTGDPTFAGPLAGVQLGLTAYHAVEPEFKEAVDADVYDDQVGMMEMVLDVDEIAATMKEVRGE